MSIAIYGFCAVAFIVAAGGALRLRKDFFWCGGLIIAALAAAAYAGAMGGSAVAFKLYYALGASMLPGWIGAGSLRSAFGPRLARVPGIFVIMLSAVQLGLTVPATVDPAALRLLDGGNGSGILVMGSWVVPTVLFNTFGLGFAAVAAFFAWWRAFRVQDEKLAAMAVGLSVVAVGILVRSDAVYKMLVQSGAGAGFMLADAAAFGLVWLGAEITRRLPLPLRRALLSQPG